MNNYRMLLSIVLIIAFQALNGQDRVYTKNGQITFFSKAPMESIEAKNQNVTCVLDTKSGQVQFVVLMKGFEFRKALMQEHFNENYVESNKFPKGEFKGQVLNNGDINYSREGTYTAKVKGMLSIHGETKEVETSGTITVKEGKVSVNAAFGILLSEYKIAIPALVKDKVSNNVTITVNCSLETLKS